MDGLPILLTDDQGTIVRANAPAVRRFGPCLGKRCVDVVGLRAEGGESRCSHECAGHLARSPMETRSGRGLVHGAPAQVYCTCMARGVVVVLHEEPAADAIRGLLSPREIEVVRLVAEGHTMKSAARELGVATTTVRSHLDNAKLKLGASTLPELVTRALDSGLKWRG